MNPFDEDFYTDWRNRHRATDALRDENGFPAERLLQAVWRHQRLRRDQLQTLDGKTVRVLHPGFASAEGGPDFRGAVIQTGGEPPRSGDVEIDLRSDGWRAHGHDRNPNFQNVILHVVWESRSAGFRRRAKRTSADFADQQFARRAARRIEFVAGKRIRLRPARKSSRPMLRAAARTG